MAGEMREYVFSLRDGEIRFQWSGNPDADDVSELEDWLQLILRQMRRSVERQSPRIMLPEDIGLEALEQANG